MKKGRHRRFEEARALKLSTTPEGVSERTEPCPECSADPGDEHASWCEFETADEDDEDA